MEHEKTAQARWVVRSLRRHLRSTLDYCRRGLYIVLRWYVRYFHAKLMSRSLVKRVDKFFKYYGHRFVARTDSGFRLNGNTTDIIQRYIYLFGKWEPNLSRFFEHSLSECDIFIDVGANIGFFSLLASRRVGPKGMVISIEASPTVFAKLKSNMELNDCANIRLVNCAASDRMHSVRMYRGPAGNLGATSSFANEGSDDGEVPAWPLSQIVKIDEMERTRIIKIDVEGAETAVVNGMLPLLRHARPDLVLAIEVGGGPKGSPSAAESARTIIPLMLHQGFNVYQIENIYEPEHYGTPERMARPIRVVDYDKIASECDLIFSRRDLPNL